jgi:hypothetical protein
MKRSKGKRRSVSKDYAFETGAILSRLIEHDLADRQVMSP